jgi:hypothetical protein
VVLGICDRVLTTSADGLRTFSRDVAAGIDGPYLALHATDPEPDYVAWLEALVTTATMETGPASGTTRTWSSPRDSSVGRHQPVCTELRIKVRRVRHLGDYVVVSGTE